MKHRTRPGGPLVGLALCLATAGCAAEAEDTGPTQLTLTVDPKEGATLDGGDLTAFEGFSLEVPAGALTQRTTFKVRVGVDETPLPDRAFGVGAQFLLEASPTVALAEGADPMRVTLPAFDEIVGAYGQESAMVKVWLKASGSPEWKLVEGWSNTGETVSVRTTEAGALHAGVKMDEVAGLEAPCLTAGTCSLAVPVLADLAGTACASAYCRAAFPDASPKASYERLTQGSGKLVYLSRSVDGLTSTLTLQAQRVDPLTGAVEASGAAVRSFTEAGDLVRDRGLVAQGNDVYVGLRDEVVRLSFGASAAPGVPAVGAALEGSVVGLTSNGTVVWAYERETIVRAYLLAPAAAAWAGPYTVPMEEPDCTKRLPAVSSSLTLAADRLSDTRFWVVRKGSTAAVHLCDTGCPGSISAVTDPLQLLGAVAGLGPVASGADGSIAALALGGGQLWLRETPGDDENPEFAEVEAADGLRTLVSDDSGGYWGVYANLPAIAHLDAVRKVTVLDLRQTGGTPDLEVPTAIVWLPSVGVAVLDRGGKLWKLTQGSL